LSAVQEGEAPYRKLEDRIYTAEEVRVLLLEALLSTLYHFSLQIQPKMRRYFPRQRDGTFAGRTGDGYAFAGRLTGRPHRRGDADASASQHKQRASRTCPASRDRVDLYCELVLPSTLGEDMISDTELAELDRRHAARPNGGSGDVPEKDTVYHLRKGRSR